MVEFDGGDGGRGGRGDSRRQHVRLGIEQLEDALGGRHGALQDVVLLAEVLNGPEEAQAVLQEGHHHAQREARRGCVREAAVGQNAGQRQHGDELHHRIEPAVGGDGVLVGFHVLAVDHLEILRGCGLRD